MLTTIACYVSWQPSSSTTLHRGCEHRLLRPNVGRTSGMETSTRGNALGVWQTHMQHAPRTGLVWCTWHFLSIQSISCRDMSDWWWLVFILCILYSEAFPLDTDRQVCLATPEVIDRSNFLKCSNISRCFNLQQMKKIIFREYSK